MKLTRLSVLATAGWLFVSGVQAASQAQSLASIEQSAIEHVRSLIHPDARVSLEPLDSRLRLPACNEILNTAWSPGSRRTGRVTVQVSCESTSRWRIHVQATVTHEAEIWIISRPVRRGEVLSLDMVKQQHVLIGDPSSRSRYSTDPVSDIGIVEGYEFTRAARSGEPLDDSMLRPRKLVLKGESVVLSNTRPGLSLTAKGTAMADAAIGDRIQVRNDMSHKVIDAIVLGRGHVEALSAR